MLITCWSVKGGSGVSVVAAALARLMVGRHGHAALVDLGGDQPAVLGASEPQGRGVLDWCDSRAEPEALSRLGVEVGADLLLVPRGSGPTHLDAARGAQLVQAVRGVGPVVVVDAGTPLRGSSTVGEPGVPSTAEALEGAGTGRHAAEYLRDSGSSLFVTRSCYLSLRRANALGVHADGVVLVSEPGRALGSSDVGELLGLPVIGVVEADPAVSRAVDSGTLGRRLPHSLARGLRRAG